MTDEPTNTNDDSEQGVSLALSTLDNKAALEKAEETTQLNERRLATDVGRGIVPPYNPETLAAFQELNETHAACIRKKSRYEVGYGFDIVPHPYADDPDPDGDQRSRVEDFWYNTASRWQTGPNGTAASTPEEVLELARQDYHGIGWLALEILVEGDGTPVGLAHVPATTVRVRKSKTTTEDGEEVVVSGHGYVQIRQGRRRYFGEAGDRYGEDTKFVDKETGDVAESAEELENEPANELLFMQNPSALSLYYGIPDWVAAMQTMAADQAAKEWNHDVFDNLGIPYYVVKVTGGTLTESSKDDLRELMDNLKGTRYRTAILEVERFEEQNLLEAEDGSDISIELEPIGSREDLDMEFEKFRARNEHEIAKVHEVPPILINVTETSNRSNSKEQVREFAEDVIAPEQAKFESRLYTIIHQTALDVEDWTIDFELRGAERPKEEAQLSEQRVRSMRLAGVGTVDEAREELGLDPFGGPIGELTLAGFEAQFGNNNTGGDGGGETASMEGSGPVPEQCVGKRNTQDISVKAPIDMQSFDSSNLVAGLYDFETRDLYIRFHGDPTDRIYIYLDVPAAVWDGLVNAASHGSYHHEHIKWDYVYEELSATDWPQVGAAAPSNNDTIQRFLNA